MKKTKITFGKIGIGLKDKGEPPSVTNSSESDVSGFGLFGKASSSLIENEVNKTVSEETIEENPEADKISSAMGFTGFGKKARIFDIEKLAEQTRKDVEEKNRANIEKLTLDNQRKEEENEDNQPMVGPPLPPSMQTNNDAEDGVMGPPLPPSMLAKTTDVDSEDDEEEEDGYKLPISHELPLFHGEKTVSAIAMDPSGSRLVSGSLEYNVKYWDFQGMDITHDSFRGFVPHDGYPIQAVDYSASGDKVLVVSKSNQAKVYDRDGIELFECAKGDMYLQDMSKTKGHIAALTHGCWHPKDKSEFLTSARDGTCRIWHTNTSARQLHVIKARAVTGLKAKPTSCCYSRDGLIVACVCDDGSIQMWDHRKNYVNTTVNVRNCHDKGTDTTSISFSYDNKYYATRGMDDTMKLWDIRKPKSSVFTATGLFNRFEMTDCLFSPNDQLVITGTSMDRGDNSGMLVMFNRNTWKLEHDMPVGNSHIVSLVWHPRLNQICVGSGDGKVRILYDPELSHNGAVLAASKRKKRHKETSVIMSQQIMTPHALPLFKEERHKSTRKLELKDRKDPVKSHRPDLPLGKAGTGGRVSAGGSTLSSYIIRNLGLQNKKAEDDEGDPREALLKYDKLAKEDPYWVSPAYATTQPKVIFREEEETVSQNKNKKQKTSEG